MQKITGLDQMFFGMDTPTTNSMLGGLVRFAPLKEGQTGPDEAFMRKRLAERLRYIPPMSKVVREGPLGIDYGYLANAGRIDLVDHIRTITLPEPGDDRSLAEEVSRLVAMPLDKTRPLWDLTIINGLADGSMALLLRLHHGVVDGSTMPQIWDLFSDDPTEAMPESENGTGMPQPFLGEAEMAYREITGVLRKPLDLGHFSLRFGKWMVERWPEDGVTTLPGLAARFIPGPPGAAAIKAVNNLRRRRGAPDITPFVANFQPPNTPFNGRIGTERNFAFSEMPLAEIKALGKRMGATLNNVVVAISAGAVRRFLEDHGGVPDQPLSCSIPVSLRHEDMRDPWSNHVFMMFPEFPTHIADPIERVKAVTKDLGDAKASFDALPYKLIREGMNFAPRDMVSWMFNAMVRLPERFTQGPYNVVVSNVRGPVKPAEMNGVRVLGYWPCSFLAFDGGMNITLQSYVDTICFGFSAAPQHIPDLWPMVDYMNESVAELKEAIDAKERREAGQVTAAAATSRPTAAPATKRATKTAAKRATAARKASAKKATASKTATKRTVAQKATTKKAAAKKATAKKSTASKTTTKKATATKSTAPTTTAGSTASTPTIRVVS